MIKLVDPEKRPVHWYMDINVSADQLWALFSNFRSIADWWPEGAAKMDFIGDGIGMIRNIYPEGGELISQRLDAMNEAGMIVESTFLNCEDFGIKYFHGSISVKALKEDWSRLTYAAVAEVIEDNDHDDQMDAIEIYLDGFFKSLKAQMENRGIATGDEIHRDDAAD